MTAGLDSGVVLAGQERLSLGGEQYWAGDLVPHTEGGAAVVEEYRGVRATLLRDAGGDYLRFDRAPGTEVLDDFYNAVYPAARRRTWYNVEAQYDPRRWTSIVDAIGRLADELGLPPEQVRVHDVGCGFGGLVHQLRQHGYQASGTDLCREAIADGAALRGNSWVFDEPAQQYLERVGPQHVIVLNHMIEHATTPLELVRGLVDHLLPGGFLVVRCPNSQYVRSQRESIRASWYGFPKHLHYFGPRSLGQLLALAGLVQPVVRCTDTDMLVEGELDAVRALALPGEFPEDDGELLQLLRLRMWSKEVEGIGRRP